MSSFQTSFEVRVAKDTFKFNAAHFVAFKNFRERLHGHNYQVAVKLLGSRKIGHDGYVVDFGDIKAVTKKVCKSLNEHFLCPMLSDVITISVIDNNSNNNPELGDGAIVKLVCEDGAVFVFPKQDCLLLPLVHATAEELAIYLWGKILQGLDATFLRKRGIHTMEVTVAEAVGQEALFRHEIPSTNNMDEIALDVRTFIDSGEITPTPCFPVDGKKSCDGSCEASQKLFSAKLQQLADSLNSGKLQDKLPTGGITGEDLQKLIE
ncbi:Inherit from COG: 6-pyruvoyltetrahydropterin synthase activity [Seminavis robusta]|uniref:6-pyruvoyltetrahydropterin synthase n=1 Tax=Seminavis robusta TaxID=568900 RepID=A0A9N8EDM4_9STRA|nr:Inherit from COG: 6-pyruvoyltetrahydropterin synthase activity [Seminavis robusta]|eukprot:Sro850_g210610.1 Inherit from COG: 6-pyruvoyltetrahydropterin synthase activity (264) ;mRNA; f:11073-11864